MQKYNYSYIKQLEDKIKEKRKPIRIRIQNEYIPLTLTKTTQLKLINKGLVALTLNQLWQLIKDCENVDQQRQKVLSKTKAMKEGIKTANQVKNLFEGTITNFK